MDEKSYVGMAQHQCPVCLTCFDTGEILLDTRLRNSLRHKEVTGHSPCPDCQAKADEDYIALIEAGNTHSQDTLTQEAAKRTGNMAWIRRSAFLRIFNCAAPTRDRPIAFIEVGVIEALNKMQSEAE